MAALQCTVTPGHTFADDVLQTADDFNAAASPTVEIAEGAIQPEHIDVDALVTEIGDTLRGVNYLPWGNVTSEAFREASVTCAAAQWTFPHPGWQVKPTGAAVTATFQEKTSNTATAAELWPALKLTAGGTLTELSVGWWIPPGLAQMLGTDDAVLSVHVYNRSGATFTPSLRISTPNTAGDQNGVIARTTVTGASQADSVWARQQFSFDATPATGVTNWNYGALLEIVWGTGVFTSGEIVHLAAAQLDIGSLSALINVPARPSDIPPGVLMPYAGTVQPPGWLWARGGEYEPGAYPALFMAIGYGYGTGSGSKFIVPDLRGRIPVGLEIAGSTQQRAEVAVAVVSAAGDTLTVASGATAPLRLGMGVYGHANVVEGSTIIALTDTTIQLSASTTGTFGATVYFSKLGAANAQTLAAAGAGLSAKRRKVTIVKEACSTTSASTTLTLKNVSGLACGMTVSGTGIPAGTTIAAFLTATTLRLSAAATANATATLQVTFGIDAPEGDEMAAYLKLRQNPLIQLTAGSGTDTTLVGLSSAVWSEMLVPGMVVTCSHANVTVSDHTVVVSVSGSTVTITPGATVASNGDYEFQFSTGATQSRETTAQTSPTPGFQTFNYVIKT